MTDTERGGIDGGRRQKVYMAGRIFGTLGDHKEREKERIMR
jgi:hypothetical protein